VKPHTRWIVDEVKVQFKVKVQYLVDTLIQCDFKRALASHVTLTWLTDGKHTIQKVI